MTGGDKFSVKEVIAMPGFDGTGPRGDGPKTGWGVGYCARPWNQATIGPQDLQSPIYGVGRGGLPRGGGRGRAFGGRRGWPAGRWRRW